MAQIRQCSADTQFPAIQYGLHPPSWIFSEMTFYHSDSIFYLVSNFGAKILFLDRNLAKNEVQYGSCWRLECTFGGGFGHVAYLSCIYSCLTNLASVRLICPRYRIAFDYFPIRRSSAMLALRFGIFGHPRSRLGVQSRC